MSKSKTCEAVRVVVRCRPFSRREAGENILDLDGKLGQITIRNPKASPGDPLRVFTFDAVFGWESRQGDIYEDSARPLVESVLQGFNGTIFAYGQTGTGKTHTMQGDSGEPDMIGVIPNSFQHIFTHISRSQNQKYLVRSSYLEIYQEEIRDLLRKDKTKSLELKEDPDSGVYVKDLSSVVTKNATEIQHVMQIGNQSRSVGFTHMNERSSRSHAIFVVTVECSLLGPDGEEHIRVGKLNMVDLAGSERQRKTRTRGARLKEAAKINLSLAALGNVISALVDRRSTHVPYRNSKLTRLLQDSLGGNAKTVMIATVGPSHQSFEESLSTLRYASRAKNIKNRPRINEDPKDALLKEFQEEISRLKAQLEERGVLARERRRRKRSHRASLGVDMGADVGSGGSERLKERTGKRKSLMEELQWDQDAVEKILEKYQVMESKLLVGGKTIIDHTNEQQKMLETKKQEISDQIRQERVIQQQMMLQDEETLEMRETFSSLQQEVELKTKKLMRFFSKLQLLKAEMRDVIAEQITTRQELEETQAELTRELKYKTLLMENFIPQEEKNKIMDRLHFDSEEDQWRLQTFLPESAPAPVRRRPSSAVGFKRPISQYAQTAAATATGVPCRYQAENVMLLELDMSPPTMFNLNLHGAHLETAFSPRLMQNLPVNERERSSASSRVRRSQSWYQAPQAASIPSSSSSRTQTSELLRQRPSSAAFLPLGGPALTSP